MAFLLSLGACPLTGGLESGPGRQFGSSQRRARQTARLGRQHARSGDREGAGPVELGTLLAEALGGIPRRKINPDPVQDLRGKPGRVRLESMRGETAEGTALA